jgi:putative cell wall-binding protein
MAQGRGAGSIVGTVFVVSWTSLGSDAESAAGAHLKRAKAKHGRRRARISRPLAALAATALLLPMLVIAATSASATTTITDVSGFPVDNNDPSGVTTLTLPTGAVGNEVVVVVSDDTGSPLATAVSSTNIGALTSTQTATDAYHNLSLWTGRVQTAGTDTVTVTFASSVSGDYTEISADEFSSTAGSATTWIVGQHGASFNNSSSTNLVWPALTSATTTDSQVYAGFGSKSGNSASASTTITPSGFVSEEWPDPSDNLTISDTGLASNMAYTPTNAQSATAESDAIGVIIAASTLPGAPTGVSAMAGNGQATVNWTAPVTNGGNVISSYTITSSPGGLTASSSGPAPAATVVTGLTNGQAYTFIVSATNIVGIGAASAPSSAVTPTAPASGPSGPAPTTPSTPVRVSGADRFGTAISASQTEFPTAGSAGAVVLARSDDYPDALVGSPLAKAKNAPLLFAEGGILTPATTAEIQRVLPAGGTIYILGGTTAVPTSVQTTLTGLGYTVTRYAGADRYATALLVAGALGNPSTVLLATGNNFPDALSAGPAAAKLGGAVLLTNGSTLPSTVSAYLTAHPGTDYAVGVPATLADPAATQLAGADRYATAALVAGLFSSPTVAGVASGATFPDALTGGAYEAHVGGPLLLTDPVTLPGATSSYLTGVKGSIVTTDIFGGTVAISATVQTQIATALGL